MRLIDADALRDKLQAEIDKVNPPFDGVLGSIRCGVRLARNMVEDEPTVDAEPVRHGHWVKSEDADDGYCSVCECDMPMYREDWEWKYSETPYCPNCGAKMDEVEDG